MEARYLTLADDLRAEVAHLAPNTILPTEVQLARRFGVSRVTVRQALGVLERGGLLSRQRGRGTIVSPPKVVRSLTPISNLEEDLGRQRVRLETRVLRLEKERDGPPDIRALLPATERLARVGFVALLRLVDDRVIAYDCSWFRTDIGERLDPVDLTERPLFDIARRLAGDPMTFLEWEIEIRPAPREAAAALGITAGLPVVSSTSTLCREDGGFVVRTDRFYRIDRVKFRHAARYPS